MTVFPAAESLYHLSSLSKLSESLSTFRA